VPVYVVVQDFYFLSPLHVEEATIKTTQATKALNEELAKDTSKDLFSKLMSRQNKLRDNFRKTTEQQKLSAQELIELEELKFQHEVEIGNRSLEQQRIRAQEKLLILQESNFLTLEEEKKRFALLKQLRDFNSQIEDAARKKSVVGNKSSLDKMNEDQTIFSKAARKINEGVTNSLTAGFTDMFKNIGNGWESFADGFKAIGENLKNVFINVVAEMAAEWVVGLKIQNVATKVWAGIQAVATAAVAAAKAAASAFAAVPFPLNFAAAATAALAALSLVKGLFADGVRGFSGGLALVGERGPELVNLPGGSDVFNNTETRSFLTTSNNSKSSHEIIIVNNFNNNTFLGTLEELTDEISDKIFEKIEFASLV